jgi:hypothetical protein
MDLQKEEKIGEEEEQQVQTLFQVLLVQLKL